MKFSDIPQYTQDSGYAVDIPLTYLEEHIDRYRKSYNLDMDVDFQRSHVWSDAQQSAFMEHLLKGGQGSNEIRFNCPGWMGSTDKIGPMVVVDGKQRLTACSKFLNNELPVFGGVYYKDFEGKLSSRYALRVRVNCLRDRAEVLQWYLDINTGGTPHTEAEINRVHELLEKEKGK